MLEVLDVRCKEQSSRTARWLELIDVAVQGIVVRSASTATASTRLRIAQLSLASSSGLAVMFLLLGEWLPGRAGTEANDRFGPFISPGAVLYLSVIATAVLVSIRALRAAAVLSGFNAVGPLVLVVLPHVTDQTRPTAPALVALQLFSVGVLVGWGQLNRSPMRAGWPAIVGLVAGSLTWFTNRTMSSDDDRLTFYGIHGGLDDVALVAVLGVAAAVTVGLVAAAYDRSWLAGILVVSVGWAGLGVRVAAGPDGRAFMIAYLVVWLAGSAGLASHRHIASRRRVPANA